MSLFLYAEEAPFTSAAPTTMRLFRSENNGVTWTELDPVTDATSLFDSHLLARNGQVYVGQTTQASGINGFTPTAVIARTVDAGVTWQGVVPSVVFPGQPNADSQWNVHAFLDFGDDTILALGAYTDDAFNTFFGLLRSTNAGVSFEKHTPAGYVFTTASVAACRLTTGVGIAIAIGTVANPMKVLKTTDSGATWTQIATVPYIGVGGANIPYSLVRLAGGRLVLAGEYGGIIRQPGIWTSDDDGATWASNAFPVAGFDLLKQHQGLSLAPAPAGLVLSISGRADTEPGFSPFWLSTDDGDTFPAAGSYSETHSQLGIWSPLSSCVADDGSIVVAYTSPGTAVFVGPDAVTYQVWRGVIAGAAIAWTKTLEVNFLSSTAACGHAYVVNAGVLPEGELIAAGLASTKLDCGTPIGPNPCPQECD